MRLTSTRTQLLVLALLGMTQTLLAAVYMKMRWWTAMSPLGLLEFWADHTWPFVLPLTLLLGRSLSRTGTAILYVTILAMIAIGTWIYVDRILLHVDRKGFYFAVVVAIQTWIAFVGCFFIAVEAVRNRLWPAHVQVETGH